MELINKIEHDGRFVSGYTFDVPFPDKVVRRILDNGYGIISVEVEDSMGDIGFKSFGGRYSADEYLEKYGTIESPGTLLIYLDTGLTSICIDYYMGTVVLSTSDPNLDLRDILAEKDK